MSTLSRAAAGRRMPAPGSRRPRQRHRLQPAPCSADGRGRAGRRRGSSGSRGPRCGAARARRASSSVSTSGERDPRASAARPANGAMLGRRRDAISRRSSTTSRLKGLLLRSVADACRTPRALRRRAAQGRGEIVVQAVKQGGLQPLTRKTLQPSVSGPRRTWRAPGAKGWSPASVASIRWPRPNCPPGSSAQVVSRPSRTCGSAASSEPG